MSGHSKWASIKHQKGVADARRGQLFTKLTRESIVSVRQGGTSADTNFRLRLAVQKARDSNMPLENIERAIKRGSGELEGVSRVEMVLEGYGPGGVALYLSVLTDNKNRTVAEIRYLLSKNGGNLGESGCVAWIFEKKGYFKVEKANFDEEELFLISVDAGAEDMKTDDEEYYEIYTESDQLESVRAALENQNVIVSSAEITMIPQNTIKLEDKDAEQMLKLMDALDDHDDIQEVYANFDIDDEVFEKVAE